MNFQAYMELVASGIGKHGIKVPFDHPLWLAAMAMAWREGLHVDKTVTLILNFYGIMKEGTH